ncbi:hypothetical protein GDO86_016296 [Hymenochirus boettgeri]|uniref:Uncharacterized protein n=1 Tax=Hymenochirus boettgeri TaxID=247094 RepID=A0A8T2K4P5_9PIPI|nr:hypothetical protein GDO86_016296 [Hymenochirus boettgeri]
MCSQCSLYNLYCLCVHINSICVNTEMNVVCLYPGRFCVHTIVLPSCACARTHLIGNIGCSLPSSLVAMETQRLYLESAL